MITKKLEKQAALSTQLKIDPVWITIANASKVFGIGRTKINQLMNARLIKFTQVKDKHQVRGRVLINYKSLKDLFESWATSANSKDLERLSIQSNSNSK